ncbi:MAG: hypothetical protein HRU20_09685 [Pseudomonadales bacterium]|nr:hypothetical protein [Pseudomonadales bacterium]
MPPFKFKPHLRSLLVGLLFIIPLSQAASISNPASQKELSEFKQVFTQGLQTDKQQSCKKIQFSGIRDKTFFDLVAKEIKRVTPTANTRKTINYAALMTQCLAYSGQERYKIELQNIIEGDAHKKLKRYAKKSLTLLQQYSLWAPIISDGKAYNPKLNLEENRSLNMLNSDDLALKRIGAKRVYHAHLYNPVILAFLEQDIKTNALKVPNDKLAIDTMAWKMKALAGSKDEKYKTTLERVIEKSTNKKLRKYAKRYLKDYS